MKKVAASLLAMLVLAGCSSVESAQVSGNDVAAQGEPIAVIQADAIGLSAILQLIDIVQADLDVVVNRLLVSEAKAMGASKVDIKSAHQMPTNGIYMLLSCPLIVLCPNLAQATGIAVR